MTASASFQLAAGINDFGNCEDRNCDCNVTHYRKHCVVCGKLMKGMTVIKNEVCSDCHKKHPDMKAA